MKGAFYNTTHQSGPTLAAYTAKAAKQDDAVLDLFQRTGAYLSPSQAHAQLGTAAPITSIRRAISNLTKAGLLVKTDFAVIGPWNREEGVWRAASAQRELF